MIVEVVHYLLGVHMSELHWERFEGVTLWHVALDCLLELCVRKSDASNSLKLIRGYGCLE